MLQVDVTCRESEVELSLSIMASTQVLLLQLLLASLAFASHHMGGKVGYTYIGKNSNGEYMVDFYNKGTYDRCHHELHWFCSHGNCGTVQAISQKVIDSSSNAPSYESLWCETERVERRFLKTNKPFTLRADSCCWINTRNNAYGWRLSSYVDLGTRSDTKEPNKAPDFGMLPFLRVPQNCPRTYKLVNFDADGDQVRCRYGNTLDLECSRCDQPPGFHLNQETCTLQYNSASSDYRIFAFEMVVEDFPRQSVTLTYSDGSQSVLAPPSMRQKRGIRHFYQMTTAPTTTPWHWGTHWYPTTTPYWYRHLHTTTAAATTTTAAPTTTTAAPTTTTAAPTTTTAAPTTTTAAPTTTTAAPTTTTAAPTTTTAAPTTTTAAATTTTAAPTTTTAAATTTTAAPTTTTAAATTTTAAPTTTTAAPTTTTAAPTTTTAAPTTTTTAPTTTRAAPTTTTAAPTTTTAAPTTTTAAPTTTTTAPTTTTAAPTTTTAAPTTTTAAPTTTTAAPTTTTTAPTTTTAAPTTTTAAPTTTTAAPTTTTDAPTTSTTLPFTLIHVPFNLAGSNVLFPPSRPTPATTFSKLPVHFSLLVDGPVPTCQPGVYLPEYLPPTPLNGMHIHAEIEKELEIRVKARTTFSVIDDIIFSGPQHTKKQKVSKNEFVITWTPKKEDLGNHNVICYAVEALAGTKVYQGDMRCVIVDVGVRIINTTVTCSESSMRVEVERALCPEASVDHLRLNDPSNIACSLKTHSNKTHFVAVVPLNQCGTLIEDKGDNFLRFKNEITTFDNIKDIVTRKPLLEVQFYCKYPKRGNVTQSFTAHRKSVTVWDKGMGKFTYQFEFYPDLKFNNMLDPNSYPLEYDLGDRIYMQIEAMSSVNNTELFVETCTAAPYDNPNYKPAYTIIQNGCKVDPTVQIHSAAHGRKFQFSMEAFKFIGLHDQVYISCSVVMCKAGESGSRCAQGCINPPPVNTGSWRRRKREAATQSATHLVSQGPLRLARSAELGDHPAMNLNLNMAFIAGCLLAAVGMVSGVVLYKAKISKVRYQPLPTSES